MRTNIENNMLIEVTGLDLTTVSNIEFYIKQPTLFLQYTPQVVSANQMLVHIPFEDAKKLKKDMAMLQFAYTDANDMPNTVDPISVSVKTLLKEAGYDPI